MAAPIDRPVSTEDPSPSTTGALPMTSPPRVLRAPPLLDPSALAIPAAVCSRPAELAESTTVVAAAAPAAAGTTRLGSPPLTHDGGGSSRTSCSFQDGGLTPAHWRDPVDTASSLASASAHPQPAQASAYPAVTGSDHVQEGDVSPPAIGSAPGQSRSSPSSARRAGRRTGHTPVSPLPGEVRRHADPYRVLRRGACRAEASAAAARERVGGSESATTTPAHSHAPQENARVGATGPCAVVSRAVHNPRVPPTRGGDLGEVEDESAYVVLGLEAAAAGAPRAVVLIRAAAVPEDLTCPVCLGVACEPTVTECGHIFCRRCITAAVASRRECPLDRLPISEGPHSLRPDVRAQRQIARLPCVCPAILSVEQQQRVLGTRITIPVHPTDALTYEGDSVRDGQGPPTPARRTARGRRHADTEPPSRQGTPLDTRTLAAAATAGLEEVSAHPLPSTSTATSSCSTGRCVCSCSPTPRSVAPVCGSAAPTGLAPQSPAEWMDPTVSTAAAVAAPAFAPQPTSPAAGGDVSPGSAAAVGQAYSTVSPAPRASSSLALSSSLSPLSPSEGRCSWSGVVADAAAHLRECPHYAVPCPYAPHGCEALVPRGLMELHIQDSKDEHMRLIEQALEAALCAGVTLKEELKIIRGRCWVPHYAASRAAVAHSPSPSNPSPTSERFSMSLSPEVPHGPYAGSAIPIFTTPAVATGLLPLSTSFPSLPAQPSAFLYAVQPPPPPLPALSSPPVALARSHPLTGHQPPARPAAPLGLLEPPSPLTPVTAQLRAATGPGPSPVRGHVAGPPGPPLYVGSTTGAAAVSPAAALTRAPLVTFTDSPTRGAAVAVAAAPRGGAYVGGATGCGIPFIWVLPEFLTSCRRTLYSRAFTAYGLTWCLGIEYRGEPASPGADSRSGDRVSSVTRATAAAAAAAVAHTPISSPSHTSSHRAASASAADPGPGTPEDADYSGLYLFAQGHPYRVPFRLFLFNADPHLDVVHTVEDWAESYRGKGWGPVRFINRRTVEERGFISGPQKCLRVGIEILGPPY